MSAIQAVIAARASRPASEQRHNWRASYLALHMALLSARKAKGLSQPECARLIGCGARTFQRWENDESEPTASELFKWAAVLGLAITFNRADDANNGAVSA